MAKSEHPGENNTPITLKKIKFLVGSIVYLVTDIEQLPRVVIAVHLKAGGYAYELRYATDDSSLHSDIEISKTRDKELINRYLINPNNEDAGGDTEDDEE